MPNQTTLDTLRTALEEERDHLVHQLEELGYGGDGALSFDENFADSAQVAAEQGEARVLAGQIADNLREVERALAKLGGGGYGVCEVCGREIGEARLEAMPATRFCIECASRR